jgi:hypothetical protein
MMLPGKSRPWLPRACGSSGSPLAARCDVGELGKVQGVALDSLVNQNIDNRYR